MGLVEIIILIVAVVCLFEWDELRHNNIRHDENKFFVMGVILLIILFIVLYFNYSQNPANVQFDE